MEVVKPYLTDKLNQSFPDPTEFDNEESFLYAAKTASVFKKVVAEFLMWIEGQIETAKVLEEKKKGEGKDPFTLEGE